MSKEGELQQARKGIVFGNGFFESAQADVGILSVKEG